MLSPSHQLNPPPLPSCHQPTPFLIDDTISDSALRGYKQLTLMRLVISAVHSIKELAQMFEMASRQI